jgi:hypothetical protein
MSKPFPIAALCTDVHLSAVAPVARSAEPDWYQAQARYLLQLKGMAGDLPIIYGGDIFHKWNSPPELINFALEFLPDGWAIPGQHDLSYHQYEGIHKSAFGTLVRAGKLKLLPPLKPTRIGDHLRVWGFPWGTPLKMLPTFVGKDAAVVDLAVVHAYIWVKGKGFPGADDKHRLGAYNKALSSFDAALFGDNHKGFLVGGGDSISVFNHGAFQPRSSDERHYTPKLGMLMSDSSIRLYPYDTSRDKWMDIEEAKFQEEEGFKMQSFLKELQKLGVNELDFSQALQGYFKRYEISEQAKKIIMEAFDYDIRY